MIIGGLQASTALADTFSAGTINVEANSAVVGNFATVTPAGPTITEDFGGQWDAGTTFTFTAPLHFAFDTTIDANATVIGGDIVLDNAGVETPAANTLVFSVNTASTVASTVRFPDIRLRAVDCTGGVAGNAADILLTVNDADSVLSNVAIIDVTVLAGPAVDHFDVAAVPVTQAAGSPIVITLTARDLCNNLLANFLPAAPINITAAGGIPALRSFASGGAANALTIVDNLNNTATVPVATAFDALGTGSFEVTSPSGEGPVTISATLGAATGNTNVNWVLPSCSLDPLADTNAVGDAHTITATVLRNGVPAAGVTVNFNVTAGPNVGQNNSDATDGAGEATFTYNGLGGFGIDTIQASGTIDGIPFVCAAAKTWIAPVCVLTPPGGTSLVNSDHTVTSTVLLNGAFAAGVLVNYSVTAGPNAGTVGNDTTDALGEATFTYNGAGGIGVDTIEASATISGVNFTCTTTREWINTGCSLDPPTDINQAGTAHTVTISVLRNGVPPLFPPGVVITFDVTAGPNLGATGMDTTDAAGEATFTYNSNGFVGTDTIEATGTVDGVPITCTATKEWINPSATLAPPTAINLAGPASNHTVTATVLRFAGVPAVGQAVTFLVTAGPNAGTVGVVVTDAAGEADFTYADAGGPGIDTIQASGSVDGVPWTSVTATKEWITTGCSLAPAADTNQINTAHTVTSTVLKNGLPAVNVTVNYLVTAGPNLGQAGAAITDVNGEADFTYNGTGGPGTDTIEATATIDGVNTTCTASKTWIDAACLIDPPTATNAVGTGHTVTATVVRNGAFAAGVPVNFLVTAGPNTGAAGAAVTDALGEADFNYTSNGLIGTDTIQATATVDGVVDTVCSATKEWVNAECELAPSAGVNLVGLPHAVTITVRRNGAVFAGAAVNFSVTAGPNAGQNGAGVTNASGQATFNYVSNGTAGIDNISASTTVNGIATNCTATQEWITTGCSLDPPIAANAVGTPHTVTVTVFRNGAPAVGVNVGFSVINGPNFGASQAPGLTNALGQRGFTYVSNGTTGTDTIQASGTLDGIPFSCTATKTWVQASCTLAPLTSTNQVGTAHTVTSTVLRNGAPVAGVTVNFNVTAGPNSGFAGVDVTDAAGEATFNYNSNGLPGTDTIRSAGTVDGSNFECFASKTWINNGCLLNPPTSTNQIGTNHTVTSTVLQNGLPAPGIFVTFEVIAGPNVGDIGLGITNAGGNANFTYTGDGGAGTDTIQASGIVSGVPFTCTATKTWVNTACSLLPANDINPVGTVHAVTSHVTVNGVGVPGVLVQFDVTAGPNLGETDLRITNGAGDAVFTYTSNGAFGVDTITAIGAVSGVPFSCTATKEWLLATCSLAPVTDTDIVGQSHTVTTTVQRNGAAAAGILVNFSVISGPNVGLVFNANTNGSGQAAFTYTGSGGSGTDTIQASGSISGVPFLCTATKVWQADNGNGIDPDVEDGAPNNGDGNNDGIPDKLQPNVASFLDINGKYVTIVSPAGTTLTNVKALPIPADGIIPPDVAFPVGFFSFGVEGVGIGGSAKVQIIMHSNPTVNTYYKYGPTPIIPIDHFYAFLFDGTTGSQVDANVVTLYLTDGLRGDNDLLANGIILEPGAPALQADNPAPITVDSSTCGLCAPGTAVLMPFFVSGMYVLRRGRRPRRRS